jgi:mannose-6-phosphate isomerase-like protein (cupin superfamily)
VEQVVAQNAGTQFELEGDHARLIVSGADTDGKYSLLEWVVAPEAEVSRDDPAEYGAHLHRECEETFLILSGSLDFMLGSETVVLSEGDFVRVQPGVAHGYRNSCGKPVKMLVTLLPAGLEALFFKYRSDQHEVPDEGFVAEATRRFASEFGLPGPEPR